MPTNFDKPVLVTAENSGTFDGGSGGGDNGQMEARVSKLEAAAQDTRDRLARIETRMETFATKADVSDLRADFHREINSQTWKFVTWMTGICTALIGATYFIANHVTK